MGKRTLIVKNVSILQSFEEVNGDCLLCGSVGTLEIYPNFNTWECESCGEAGYFDNIQIKLTLRDDNDKAGA